MSAHNALPIGRNDNEPERYCVFDNLSAETVAEQLRDTFSDDVPQWLTDGLADVMIGAICWERFGHIAQRHLTPLIESHVAAQRDLMEDPA